MKLQDLQANRFSNCLFKSKLTRKKVNFQLRSNFCITQMRYTRLIDTPPSTTSEEPVVKLDASDAR